ncbi:hypothetical protein ABT095_14785 [Kitasatospora sp. NPDC002227]|uniref:hypothetical protein n=1 Tax=Kitasatospora sp. NPDC002227 TaxID=3154773 RepID=UPI003328919E
MNHIIKSHPAVEFLAVFFQGRLERARAEGEDGGFSAVEWVIGIAVIIAILVATALVISGAISTKAGDVGKCITGANSTNNGGCS